MTTRPRQKRLLIVSAALAALAALGVRPAAAQQDPCAVPVTAPPGGLVATNLYAGQPRDQQKGWISIQFTAPGNAAYACVSNFPNFPPYDQTSGNQYYCYPLPVNGDNTVPQWLLDGYGEKMHVYVQYNMCATPEPSSVNPIIDLPASNWPLMCSTELTGSFQAAIVGSSTVTSPNVKINFTGRGSANFVQMSNDQTFPKGATTTIFIAYGYSDPTPWTLPHIGTDTIYIRYTNDCYDPVTSKPANVTVNYFSPTCTPLIGPRYGFTVGSSTGNNDVTSPKVTLVLNGGNAALMRVANNSSDPSGAPLIPYTTSLPFTLPPTKTSHTVSAQFCNACGKTCSYVTTYTFVLH